MNTKRMLAIAAVAIIPTLAACDNSLTAPELDLEEPVIYSGPSAFLGRSRLPQEQEPGVISPKRRNRGANHGGRLGG